MARIHVAPVLAALSWIVAALAADHVFDIPGALERDLFDASSWNSSQVAQFLCDWTLSGASPLRPKGGDFGAVHNPLIEELGFTRLRPRACSCADDTPLCCEEPVLDNFCCRSIWPNCCLGAMYCCASGYGCCGGGQGLTTCCSESGTCCETSSGQGYCCDSDQSCSSGDSATCINPTVTVETVATVYSTGYSTIEDTVTSVTTDFRSSTYVSTIYTTVTDQDIQTEWVTETTTVTDSPARRRWIPAYTTSMPQETGANSQIQADSDSPEGAQRPIVTLRAAPSLDVVASALLARGFEVDRRDTIFTTITTGTVTEATIIYTSVVATEYSTDIETDWTTSFYTSTYVSGATATVTSTTSTTVHVKAGDNPATVNPTDTSGILSVLQTGVPASAQADAESACFLQPSYSSFYTTPDWYTSLPSPAQSYYSSVNAASNTAVCTSTTVPSTGTGAKLSNGSIAGVAVGSVAGAAAIGVAVFALVKTGVLSGIGAGAGSAAAAKGAGAAGGGLAGANSAAATTQMAGAGGGLAAGNTTAAYPTAGWGAAQGAQAAMAAHGAHGATTAMAAAPPGDPTGGAWSGVSGQGAEHAWTGVSGGEWAGVSGGAAPAAPAGAYPPGVFPVIPVGIHRAQDNQSPPYEAGQSPYGHGMGQSPYGSAHLGQYGSRGASELEQNVARQGSPYYQSSHSPYAGDHGAPYEASAQGQTHAGTQSPYGGSHSAHGGSQGGPYEAPPGQSHGNQYRGSQWS